MKTLPPSRRKTGVIAKSVLIGLLFSSWAYTCSQPEKTTTSKAEPAKPDTVRVASVDFSRDIQPILQAHCTPCHFPGGKMYAKMPFDNPQTIRDHPEGIFKRIKGEDEVKKLQLFLRPGR